jgi:hypothetical protein
MEKRGHAPPWGGAACSTAVGRSATVVRWISGDVAADVGPAKRRGAAPPSALPPDRPARAAAAGLGAGERVGVACPPRCGARPSVVSRAPYELILTPPAVRAVRSRLPEAVAAAVIEFLTGALIETHIASGSSSAGTWPASTQPGVAPTESCTGSTRSSAKSWFSAPTSEETSSDPDDRARSYRSSALAPGGPLSTVGTYSRSWRRPSKVRVSTMSRATSGQPS